MSGSKGGSKGGSMGASMGTSAGAPAAAVEAGARFAPGDAVRVRDTWRPGHVRTPGYCRGRRGVIERVCGRFPNPEELAYRLSGEPAKVLYRVRFAAAELWPGDVQSPGHTVEIEIYEHWLEPA